MTKVLLTIISCVFLCVACSEDGNNYYEQQIDELYNRVITAENEIFNLQSQSEENNTAESDEATGTDEINTIDVVTSCSIHYNSYDKYYEYDKFNVTVTLHAQLDDVLKWYNISENPCKNASVSCIQTIGELYDEFTGEYDELNNELVRRYCSAWYCKDNDCSATVYVGVISDCDTDTIETITQFYSTIHKACSYSIDEVLKD